MADFVAVLKKTIGGLNDNTPEMREKVYQRARDTVAAKLAAMDPPPSPIVAERQGQALEAAITAVEAGYAKPSEIGDEFDDIFAGSPAKKPDIAASAETPAEAETPAPDFEPASTDADQDVPAQEARKRPSMFDSKADDEELTSAEPVRRPDPVLAGTPDFDKDGNMSSERPMAAPRRRGVSGGLIAAVIALIVIAGAGYGIWVNRDDFASLFSPAETVVSAPEAQEEPVAEEPATAETVAAEPAAEEAEPEIAAAEPAAEPDPEPEEPQIAAAAEEPEKFTQRLTDAGEEVDPGPAGGQPSIGEGTSVAQATQPSGEPLAATTDTTTPPAEAQPEETALPVGQRAIFYEERTTSAESTADTGSTVWSIVQESPGGDLPPEPAIRAEVTIPAKNIQLRMTIRRNADTSLPASHIIEMIFLTSEGFEGGGVDNILRVAFKPSEAAAGNPLIGIPAKIADGYFLVALSSVEAEKDANLQMMRQGSWIDIPIVYSSGRRALVTMERGVPGDRVFVDTLQTWANASSG